MPFVPKNMRRAFTTSSAAMMAAYAAKTIAASDTCRPSKKAGSAAVRNRVIYFLPRW
jgi:hypothetical protein